MKSKRSEKLEAALKKGFLVSAKEPERNAYYDLCRLNDVAFIVVEAFRKNASLTIDLWSKKARSWSDPEWKFCKDHEKEGSLDFVDVLHKGASPRSWAAHGGYYWTLWWCRKDLVLELAQRMAKRYKVCTSECSSKERNE